MCVSWQYVYFQSSVVKPKRRINHWFKLCVSVCLISWAMHQPVVFGGTCEKRSPQLPHPSTENTEENKRGKGLKNQHLYFPFF